MSSYAASGSPTLAPRLRDTTTSHLPHPAPGSLVSMVKEAPWWPCSQGCYSSRTSICKAVSLQIWLSKGNIENILHDMNPQYIVAWRLYPTPAHVCFISMTVLLRCQALGQWGTAGRNQGLVSSSFQNPWTMPRAFWQHRRMRGTCRLQSWMDEWSPPCMCETTTPITLAAEGLQYVNSFLLWVWPPSQTWPFLDQRWEPCQRQCFTQMACQGAISSQSFHSSPYRVLFWWRKWAFKKQWKPVCPHWLASQLAITVILQLQRDLPVSLHTALPRLFPLLYLADMAHVIY